MTAQKLVHITKTRCGKCGLLVHIEGNDYCCPQNCLLRMEPIDFADKCARFKPRLVLPEMKVKP